MEKAEYFWLKWYKRGLVDEQQLSRELFKIWRHACFSCNDMETDVFVVHALNSDGILYPCLDSLSEVIENFEDSLFMVAINDPYNEAGFFRFPIERT